MSNDNNVADARPYGYSLDDGKNVSAHVSQFPGRKTRGGKSCSSHVSGTSSQIRKEPESQTQENNWAKLRREELEWKATADLVLAKTRHEAVLRDKQVKLRMSAEKMREEEVMFRLEPEVLDEEYRRKRIKANLKEAELKMLYLKES